MYLNICSRGNKHLADKIFRANSIGRIKAKYSDTFILAHRIRISEILPWDRKSYLTHAILPRLSREGYIHWLYWNSRTLSSCDVIVMFKWRHHVKLHLGLFRDFWKLIFKLNKQWWARKRIHYSCEGKIEKSVPRDHLLSSLGKPRDAKRRSSGPFLKIQKRPFYNLMKTWLAGKESKPWIQINYLLSQPTYILGTQKNRLIETVLLSTQNTC